MALAHLEPLTSPLDQRQLQALQTALKDMSPNQIAWVSGYLAGLGAVEPAPSAPPKPGIVLSILYGSQTGNARAVAEQLGERARHQGIEAQVLSMGDYNARKLAKERWVLVVVSTHGEGEPPETAYALHAFLHGERAPRLESLRFAVLGLGDSSYEHFCQTAVDFDRRLDELGALRLLPLQTCDLDYQSAAADWSAKALDALAEQDGGELATRRRDNVVPLPGRRLAEASAYGKDNPWPATLLENRRITSEDAIADVRHLALAVDPGALRYRPGDALGVWPRNDPALVAAVLAALDLDGDAGVELEGAELSLRQALSERLELTQLHPKTLQAWAEHTADPVLRGLAADTARARAFVAEHQFIDLVAAYPARVEARALAASLRPLQPRLYSIASCQDETEDEVHLTLSVLRYEAHGRSHLGAASGFLAARLDPDERVGVYVAENQAFRLPQDGATPIVMVGAGTGVAPYRAFLQQRALDGDTGRNWLVFGNRHFHRDFLYQLDWQAQRRAGRLARVSLAFSRDPGAGVYVQQRLRSEGRELYRWLSEGAHLYVCGATAMGQAVHETLLGIVRDEGGLNPDAAAEYVDNLRREARYHRDLY